MTQLGLSDVLLAAQALACIVRDEYPEDYSLSDIADRWGRWIGVTDEQVEALRKVESELEVH